MCCRCSRGYSSSRECVAEEVAARGVLSYSYRGRGRGKVNRVRTLREAYIVLEGREGEN